MLQQKTSRNLLFVGFLLLSVICGVGNGVHGQTSETERPIKPVPAELRKTLELYWQNYREDDWENLFKSSHTTEKKEDFIAAEKRIKANPPLGYKAILEIALEDKMIFITSLNRGKIAGCAKILWQDGKSEWADTFTFADNRGDYWVVSSPVTYFQRADKTLKTCEVNAATLPIQIKTSLDSTKPASAFLEYPIRINTSQGFSEMIAANRKLPVTYSESFSNSMDNQKDVKIVLSQKTPSGDEKIVFVSVEIPPQPKATVNVVITLKIDKNKNFRVKAAVMETGLVKEFGPFPVQ